MWRGPRLAISGNGRRRLGADVERHELGAHRARCPRRMRTCVRDAPGACAREIPPRAPGQEHEAHRGSIRTSQEGRDPGTGERPRRVGGRSKVAAFDLTFSAPKSVSVLFAVGDRVLGGALVDAHESAVGAALGCPEREACRVRRGRGGVRHEAESRVPLLATSMRLWCRWSGVRVPSLTPHS